MSTTTKSIFTFDHDQDKLNKAIGVTEDYLTDLGEQISDTLRNYVFDENKDIRENLSPSKLVEVCATEFSYSQLVVMASFYLQDKLDGFAEHMKEKIGGMVKEVTKIALDIDEIPQDIREMLENLEENSGPIDGDGLPKPLQDFLKKLAEEHTKKKKRGDGDDD